MKNDKELLELAAKAAGYEPQQYNEQNNSLSVIKGCTANCTFSPLTDDGDALRLAVELEMDLILGLCGCIVYMRRGARIEDLSDEDPHAATRRAIVRAAAAIGERL